MLSANAFQEKYGVEITSEERKQLKPREEGQRRRLTPELINKILMLADNPHEGGVKALADDLGIPPSNIWAWKRKVPGGSKQLILADAKPNGHGVANGAASPDTPTTFPTIRPRGKRSPKGALSFSCENIDTAIVILERLRGQSGKVTIAIA